MIQEPRDAEAMDGPGDGAVPSRGGGKRRNFAGQVPIDRQETVPGHQSVLGGYELENEILKKERANRLSRLSTLPLDMLTYYMGERYLRPKPAITQWSLHNIFEPLNEQGASQDSGRYIRVREFAVRGSNAYFSATRNFPDYAAGMFVIVVSTDRTEPRAIKLDILPTGSLFSGTDSEHAQRFDLVNDDTEFCVTVFYQSGQLIAFFSLDGERKRIVTPTQGSAGRLTMPTLHRMPWLSGNQIAYYDRVNSGKIVRQELDPSSLLLLRPRNGALQLGTEFVSCTPTSESGYYSDDPFLVFCETGLLMLDPVRDMPGKPRLPPEFRGARHGLDVLTEHDCCSPDGSYVLRTINLVETKVYIFETRTRSVLTTFNVVDWLNQNSPDYGKSFGCCLIDNNHYCSVNGTVDGVTVEMRG